MVAIPGELVRHAVSFYLETRDPKGGSGGGGGRGGRGGGGGGGGSSGSWKTSVIFLSTFWGLFMLLLWIAFFGQSKQENPDRPWPLRLWSSFCRALLTMLLVTSFIDLYKWIAGRCKKDKDIPAAKVEEEADDDRATLVQNTHDQPIGHAGAAGETKGNLGAYEPLSHVNEPASPQPSLAPSPMGSRSTSPVPPPAAVHQYYDPVSR